MDDQFRVGKTSVQIGEFEIGTITGGHHIYGRGYIVIHNGIPTIFSDDWCKVMNFFLERVPADCTSHVKFVRKPFRE